MRLELPVRWNEIDKEAEKSSELTDGRIPIEPKYTHGKLSIDSSEIGAYYDIDENHIMINDKNGKVYCVAVPFNEFKKIFTEVTGQVILVVQTTEQYKSPNKSRRKPSDDDLENNILGN